MKVFLSNEAAAQLSELLLYLEGRWSIRVRNNFLNKLTKNLTTIENMPYAYPESKKMPGIRKCVISPQTSLYYHVRQERIEVLSIHDNRSQDS
jgi:plasmid stabilization system protein ParE